MKDYECYTFPNGIRLVHKQVPHTQVGHCGFMMDIGSRDERPEQQGMAHFWEHMAFKGTRKRKSFHIINRLEVVGGDLNAYTTKEKICFYASLLDLHLEKAVELLADITFEATFPEKEIAKERGVILEEMSMYEDDPADAIQDEFDALLFEGHPLGYNILGTRDSVGGFSKQDFQQFVAEHLDTDRVVFSVVCSWPFEKVLRVCRRYLEPIERRQAVLERPAFEGYRPKSLRLEKPISQAHCVWGGLAYPLLDARRLPFSMLCNLLGGNGMNSRLNMAIREKHGLAYSIYANYSPFLDTGMFAVQFATEERTLGRCLDLMHREVAKLRERPLGKLQLHTAKQQFLGQMAMAEESNLSLMLMLAKSTLDLGHVESFERVVQSVESIEASELQDIAAELFEPGRCSMLTFLPDGEE
jgi:predicted Zn-dependent peptidase